MISVERKKRVHDGFVQAFSENDHACFYVSAPGRTELGGNHTDHQHGCVLCGAVALDMTACVAPNGTNTVHIKSEGFADLSLVLGDLSPRVDERNTSDALVRGIAVCFAQQGYAVQGFDAYVVSDVLSGSGLSSSAAYEVLLSNIFNHLCGAALDAVALAKIGQYAENEYFGKPCGLMDQMACSVGGAVFIDFYDPRQPVVEQVELDLNRYGYALCIIDTCSSHDDLTEDYAAIPREMKSVAAYFNKGVLRDVDEAEFWRELPALRNCCGDRAVLRSIHFFEENRRAMAQRDALYQGDFDAFLELVRQSGLSSETLLQNIWTPTSPKTQAVTLALALSRQLLGNKGAVRVHGGGFAGTIQAYVPNELLTSFSRGIEAVLGTGTCHPLQIRSVGGVIELE